MPEQRKLISHFYLKIDGADASEELMRAVTEITVENSLHMPDVVTLVLHDPKLKWIDDPLLVLGKPIKVSTKASLPGAESKIVFDGEVVEIEPDFGPETHHLIVRAFDRLHRLSRGRKVRTFQNVTDGDLVKRLANEAGLLAEIEDTRLIHSFLFQNNESNLTFLRRRAAEVGRLLFVQGKTLCFRPLPRQGQPIELKWGEGLSEFRPRMTSISQVNNVTARGWDPKTKQEIIGQVTKGNGIPEVGLEKKAGEAAWNAFHIEAGHLISSQAIRAQIEADHLAQAVADRKAESFIEAEGVCAGDPALIAGARVKIDAVGERFGGTYFVTATRHSYNASQGYSTWFSISGQTPATLCGLLRGEEEQTHLPTGLMVGVITDNQDPEGWGRVKVRFPALSNEHASDWVRILAVGAGAQRGIQFLPEVNDEVLVGFEAGDFNVPYVLGALWNGVDLPPKRNGEVLRSGRVDQRIIRSRTGHLIVLDDSEQNSNITIEDKKGNKIVLDTKANALSMEVAGDLRLLAKGKIEISGQGVSIDGGAATVDVKASLINLN